MPAEFFERLKHVRALVFDFDGVMTDGKLLLLDNGEWLRQMNMKDGFAIKYAIEKGYRIAVISGSGSDAIEQRMNKLGVSDVYLNVESKQGVFEKFLIDHAIDIHQTLYMGDDIPDLDPLRSAGVACCPQDAVPEVKKVCHYIAEAGGGAGCVREVIELVMKAHGEWEF